MKAPLGLILVLIAEIANAKNVVFPLSMENRIVEGKISPPGAFPYMATLYITKMDDEGNEYGSFCGGSLISDRFILTAGHCIIKAVRTKVYLGAHYIEQDSEPGRIQIMVKKDGLILYEKYNASAHMYDVALIKLPHKINFTRQIQPVRLARRNQINLDEEVAIISGWGNINNNEGSEMLRYGQVRVLPDSVCKSFFGSYYHSTNICLEGKDQSACMGDSGGPAIIISEDRTPRQIGIGSYVSPWGCEKRHPFAYARVTPFLDWIHKQTGIPIEE